MRIIDIEKSSKLLKGDMKIKMKKDKNSWLSNKVVILELENNENISESGNIFFTVKYGNKFWGANINDIAWAKTSIINKFPLQMKEETVVDVFKKTSEKEIFKVLETLNIIEKDFWQNKGYAKIFLKKIDENEKYKKVRFGEILKLYLSGTTGSGSDGDFRYEGRGYTIINNEIFAGAPDSCKYQPKMEIIGMLDIELIKKTLNAQKEKI